MLKVSIIYFTIAAVVLTGCVPLWRCSVDGNVSMQPSHCAMCDSNRCASNMTTPAGKNIPSRPCVSLEQHEFMAAFETLHQVTLVPNFHLVHLFPVLLFNFTRPSFSQTNSADPGQLLYIVPILRAKCVLNT